jgi:hypothetical protein
MDGLLCSWNDSAVYSDDARHDMFKDIAPGNLDKNLGGIKLAKSKFPMGKEDERTLLKELKQAVILRDNGASVYLLPKAKDAQGNNIPGPDAIVDGKIFEFKTVEKTLRKLEARFRDSRNQGQNVFIRMENPEITKSDVIRKLSGIVNSDSYHGGFKGIVIFTIGKGHSQRTFYLKIKDLKR